MIRIFGLYSFAAALALAACAGSCGAELAGARQDLLAYEAYRKVIADTAGMVGQPEAQQLARKFGLQILNVTWEDTGRYKGSSVGPNISDMTIQVQQLDPRNEKFALTCMPVIRFPNFADKSADLSPDKFQLLVGNEQGRALQRVTLRQFLGDLRSYLRKPESWKGSRKSLLASRDSHVLVSAQACFLPVPKQGSAEFNPVLFNYQSYEGDPAVLTVLATREGTSVTVIDNKRDAFQAGATWGQRLFFNQKGERCGMMGQRLSDFKAAQPAGGNEPVIKTPEANEQQGLNMVLLIQVPLKQKHPMALPSGAPGGIGTYGAMAEGKSAARGSDVEEAVIGHGKIEGPFTEIAGLEIERDERFPIRVTVQFYKATSNGVVSEKDMAEVAAQIQKVYRDAEYVGSLVADGPTGRPTEYDGWKTEPPGWWTAFWERHQTNTGQTKAETLKMLRKLYGADWLPRDEAELAQKVNAAK